MAGGKLTVEQSDHEGPLTLREQFAITHVPLKEYLEKVQELRATHLQSQITQEVLRARDQIIETERRLHELNESAKRERAQEVDDRGRYMTANQFVESQKESNTWRLNIEKLIAAQSNDLARILAGKQSNAWLPAAIISLLVGLVIVFAARFLK